jgi:ATP-dependent protease ClpP protease subunit
MDKEHFKTARHIVNLKQGRNDWYSIKNQANGSAEIMIYDEIGYYAVTAQDFVNELRGIDADHIDLRLNSPGGSVFDGMAIYNSLKQHKAKVTAHIDGLAASIASVIAMAGDEIVIAKTAQMMIHDASALCIGNAKDMAEMVDLLNKMSDNIAGVYADRAGGDVASWRSAMSEESWYSADEAVTVGLADSVYDAKKTEDPEANWDLSVFANYKKVVPTNAADDDLDVDAFISALKGAFE